MAQHGHDNKNGKHEHHHHILPNKVALLVGGALLFLTAVTVWIAHIDLGRLNFVVAMAVATVKASLVALIFMNLWYDKKENGVIFMTSFLFLAIFIVFTSTDLFFRGDVYVKGPLVASAQAKSKLKNPWIATPELVNAGKTLYTQQCVACHGAEGKGNGPAAGSLNPPPRNFHETAGWKNGRKPTMVFKTLKEGLPGGAMASFATLPSDDRWALTHYVLSMGPKPEADTPADFTKAGIDPNAAGGGEVEEKSIPIELAMQRMAEPEPKKDAQAYRPSTADEDPRTGGSMSDDEGSTGARIYAARCVECHGDQGQGGIRVKNLGVWPLAYVTTEAFNTQSSGMASQEAFNRVVIQGLPGQLMPGNGHLSGNELRELYQYVRGLKGTR